jgi:hypothetical protein
VGHQPGGLRCRSTYALDLCASGRRAFASERITAIESLHFVTKKRQKKTNDLGQAVTDEIQVHIETIARHLRGLGLTEQQIELHVAPLKMRGASPIHRREIGVPVFLSVTLCPTRAKVFRGSDPDRSVLVRPRPYQPPPKISSTKMSLRGS